MSGNGDPGPLENPIEWLFDLLFGWFFDAFGELMKDALDLMFAVPTIDTQGVFPFGRPGGAPDSFDPGILLDGGLLEYIAAKAYDLVWLGGADTGGITIVAFIILISLYSFGGFAEMFSFSSNMGKNSRQQNLMKGLFLLLFWYPLYLMLIGGTHGAIQAFALSGNRLGGALASGMTTILAGGSVATIFSGPAGVAIFAIALGPYFALAGIMQIRAFAIGAVMIFGPFIIAGKFSTIPVISRICDQILKKTVPIVLMPIPMGPIMYVFNELLLNSGSTAFDTVFMANPLTGALIVLVLGWTLLLSVWLVFKIISPQMAGAGSSIVSIGTTAAVIASGGSGAAASAAMRGGPLAAGARMLGNKVNNPWPGNGGRNP